MKFLPRLGVLFLVLLFPGFEVLAQSPATPTGSVKLLTIGNSFADNATRLLPEFAKAGGKSLLIFRANLAGHSFKQHADYLLAPPEDPKSHPYKNRIDPVTGEKKNFSLPEILKLLPWNFVTIQQFSQHSFRAETYEPYAGTIVALIHQLAPQAKILVHQTWAYRPDHYWFAKPEKFDQQKMFDGLNAAYDQLAKTYHLEILPVGLAFQLAQKAPEWTIRFPDASFDYKNPPENAIPDQTGSLYVGWVWKKDIDGKTVLRLDATHANTAGSYLGAAVWYEGIFGENVEKIAYVPPGLTPEAAAGLRKIAHEAVVESNALVAAGSAK